MKRILIGGEGGCAKGDGCRENYSGKKIREKISTLKSNKYYVCDFYNNIIQYYFPWITKLYSFSQLILFSY